MLTRIREVIDREFDRYIEILQNWVRQPSMSYDGEGIGDMVNLVSAEIQNTGGETTVFDIDDGYPIIIGEYSADSDYTLLFYNHYDVQTVDPVDEWRSPPFSASITDGTVFGRGVADDKGCLLSRILAVGAVQKAMGGLPINVKFLVEGEEEIGSPHLEHFILSHKEALKADACIWEYAAKDRKGHPTATLGNKGMCYVELHCRGAGHDFHSMYAPLVPNAAWRLVWALSTLKDTQDKVLIEGFYDGIKSIEKEERDLLEKIPFDEYGFKQSASIPVLLGEVDGREAKLRLYSEPTCTICCLNAGYAGSGAQTTLPSEAMAKVDFRLVPDQKPDDIIQKLCTHLEKHGFDDLHAKVLASATPSKTSSRHPFVSTVATAALDAYDEEIILLPTSPGTGPRWMFSSWTEMPIVGLGVGNADSNIHAPNENITLNDFRQGITHIAAILKQFEHRER